MDGGQRTWCPGKHRCAIGMIIVMIIIDIIIIIFMMLIIAGHAVIGSNSWERVPATTRRSFESIKSLAVLSVI